MARPNRKLALAAAAGVAGTAAAGSWFNARRTASASRVRRAQGDSGRALTVRGADGGYRHARIHGPADAPTLVLVHCWTGTMELWHRQIAELQSDFRIVTYDHRGHGLSDDARDGDYSLNALASDLALVLEASLGDGEAPLIAGHSMGAMTIGAWADATRGSVKGLIRGAAMISTGLEQLTAESAVIGQLPAPFVTFQGKLADAVLESPGPMRGLPVPLIKAGAAYAALGPGARDEDIELTARMALDCRPRARAGCGQAMSKMALLEKLDALEVPTIVVAGERDLMTPVVHAERIELGLPRPLGLRVAPDAGHMTPLEAPEVVNAALRELHAATGEHAAREAELTA